MSEKLTFSWRDVPRAAKLGFSAKKIALMVIGMFVATIVYALFEYLALLSCGKTLSEIWHAYRFVPFPFGENFYGSWTVLGKILHFVAIFLATVVMILTGVAVSKVTYEQLKGDEFYEMSKAIKFALKEGRAAVFAPITLILMILAIIFVGVILGLIGKIPYLGEIFLLLSSVPAFFGVILIVYLAFSFVLSLFISAPIVATTKSDTFDTLFEVFSTLNSQNWRFVIYEVILGIVEFIAVSIWIFAIGRALWIAEAVLGHPWLMGTKYLNLERIAHYYLSVPPIFNTPFAQKVLDILKVSSITSPPSFLPSVNIVMLIVGFIFGIMLYAIVFMALGYGGAMFWSGNTLIYIVLTKKKDDIDLLERKEEEEISLEYEESEKEEKKEEETSEEKVEKAESQQDEQQKE